MGKSRRCNARFIHHRQPDLNAQRQPQGRGPRAGTVPGKMTETVLQINAARQFMKHCPKRARAAKGPIHDRIVRKRLGENIGDEVGVIAPGGADSHLPALSIHVC